MAYWWYIERKNYKDEPIKVSPALGEKVQQAWLAGQQKIFLPHLKIALDASDIKAVEPSTEVIKDDSSFRLPSGVPGTSNKRTPQFTPDFEENGMKYQGAVICNWYKKNIDKREWENYYSKCPWYLRIDDATGACWIAMLLPEDGATKPDFLLLCDKNEQQYLNERKRNA